MKTRNDVERISPTVVIIVCMTISLVIVSGLFFLRSDFFSQHILNFLPENFARVVPQRNLNFDQLLLRGRPEEVLGVIRNRAATGQLSDTMFYWRGRAWYLVAWQRYENDRWREYAKNPADWFVGPDVDSALYFLYRAAESDNTWAQSMALIGSVYMDKGWFDRARNTFQIVLRRGPHRESHLNYGITLSRTGRYRDAADFLKQWPDYENDYDFTRNLFFLYMFNLKNYSEAARMGDLFLQSAPRGHFDVPQVIRELRDLHTRFPEYFNDNMVIIRDRPPEFPLPRTR